MGHQSNPFTTIIKTQHFSLDSIEYKIILNNDSNYHINTHHVHTKREHFIISNSFHHALYGWACHNNSIVLQKKRTLHVLFLFFFLLLHWIHSFFNEETSNEEGQPTWFCHVVNAWLYTSNRSYHRWLKSKWIVLVALKSIHFVYGLFSSVLWYSWSDWKKNDKQIRWQKVQGQSILHDRCSFSFVGYFWVLSDAHVDLFYRLDGDPASYCHNQSLNHTKKNLGKFGHYSCNPPIRLLLSAISASKKIDPNVDFLIWLG